MEATLHGVWRVVDRSGHLAQGFSSMSRINNSVRFESGN